MEISELQDDELMAQAREWRRRALRGEKDARGIAHELEREVRRRTGLGPNCEETPTLDTRPLAIRQRAPRSAWKFW